MRKAVVLKIEKKPWYNNWIENYLSRNDGVPYCSTFNATQKSIALEGGDVGIICLSVQFKWNTTIVQVLERSRVYRIEVVANRSKVGHKVAGCFLVILFITRLLLRKKKEYHSSVATPLFNPKNICQHLICKAFYLTLFCPLLPQQLYSCW